MTESLNRWIGAADAVRHMEDFHVAQVPLNVAYIRDRTDDYYISLVGDLFDRMRLNQGESSEWARLGNAFAQFADDGIGVLARSTISRTEAALYAATAFYSGGFPASAYLSIRRIQPNAASEPVQACYDLLARPAELTSQVVRDLLLAVREDNSARIAELTLQARERAEAALISGPDEWVPAHLYEQLARRFAAVNIRAVLPARANGFWDPLIGSLISRTPSTWEFFPSQIQAIRGGLLEERPSFALQMPTGAGKTTLCETLLFDHLQRHPLEAAVLLVPYRSLASELRGGVVRRLNGLGISSRCAYGGTVPTGDEVHALDETRLVVATPEALSGLLVADQQFLRRISLVICDEGHLLGAPSRGIALELLLARLKAREGGAPRFVFISAIVPNIHEINAWLGGTADSVVRSEYRPALADFALLRARDTGAGTIVDLAVHPHLPEPQRFVVEGFLTRADFRFTNPNTGRLKTLPFTSVKTRAVAAARKALPMGAVVIFAANKRGEQGAIGIAEELLEQLTSPLTLPMPGAFANTERLSLAVDYVRREFGDEWIGTRALAAAAVLHHGDVPQETREVLEDLLRRGHIMFAVCTNTLAEGVNLPIRSLVLYSVQRRSGAAIAPLLSRDIKNLVGRAGRAGATTKGLVVCANEKQWPDVARVALEQPGENLVSALRELVDRLRQVLALHNTALTNGNLEATPSLHTLVDGIDSTLIDLASEEITQEALEQLAVGLADQTFAAQSAGEPSKQLLRTVFRLRATRVANLRATGRLVWIRETGARMRMIDIVEAYLLNVFGEWETLENPIQDQFVDALLQWAWQHGQIENDIRQVYRLGPQDDVTAVRNSFVSIVRYWLAGDSYAEIAAKSGSDVNDVLSVLTGAVSYGLQSVIEQGISLLGKLLESQGRELSAAVRTFPDHLRFGVPTASARLLNAFGIRHRRAAILLGNAAEIQASLGAGRETLFETIGTLLATNTQVWRERLGGLMYENTVLDVS